MVNKLTDQKFGIEFEQLLDTVLKDNADVAAYIGLNNEGKMAKCCNRLTNHNVSIWRCCFDNANALYTTQQSINIFRLSTSTLMAWSKVRITCRMIGMEL